MPNASDDSLTREDPISADKELLETSHLPGEGRVVDRDDETSDPATTVDPATFRQSPSNALIHGKTGVGKSLCAKYVSQRPVETAEEGGMKTTFAYVGCTQDTAETQAVQTIAGSVNDTSITGVKVPDKELSTSACCKYLQRILDSLHDVVLVILDEIDKLSNDDILMQLSRADEAGKIASRKLGVIGISNKTQYKDWMDERVRSSLCECEFVFPSHDANQLRDIMDARSDAFRDGALDPPTIPRAAAPAAREHGDARKVIDILRYAGEITQSMGASAAKENFVTQAHWRAEIDRFRELIRGSMPYSRYVLQAPAILSFSNEKQDGFRTSRAYKVYENVRRQQGSDSLSLRRVRDLLKEYVLLDIIEQSRHSGGSMEGSYTKHQLLEGPDAVRDVLIENTDS